MLVWAAVAFAGSEDPGPYLPGRRDFGLVDPVGGNGWLEGTIVYPAVGAGGLGAAPDTGAGPFPMAALMHGYTGEPDELSRLADHVASWGFVVVLPGTNTGLLPDVDDYAADTRAMLVGVDALSDSGQGWLAGLVSGDPWSAIGHSMGGGTLAPLVGLEPRIEQIVGLEAASSTPAHEAMLAAFDGVALYVAGSQDPIVPAPVVHDWFELADATRRDVYVEILGGGHLAPNDTGVGGALSHEEQHRLHRRLIVAFLRAEVRGEEDTYAEIFDPSEPTVVESKCADPVLVWSAPGGSPVVSVAGLPGRTAQLASATGPGSVPTRLGEVGLEPNTAAPLGAVALGADGLGDLAASSGTWVQARVGPALTRAVEVP